MRKMKKINGYLVVRFNDREKRERSELGNFGIIDAELYSGNLMVDLDAMEYTDADLIEVAIEQARGLDSEFDMEEPEAQVTVVKDVDGVTSEESYNPVKMFDITRTLLASDIQRGMGEDIDPRTAAHELRGFARALMTMGVVRGDDERFYVALDSFGSPETDIPLTAKAPAAGSPPGEREEFLVYICDEVCKYREGRAQEELDAICARCKVDRWAGAPPTLTPQEVRNLQGLLKEADNYVNGRGSTLPPGDLGAERDTFIHAHPDIQRDRMTRKVYALGLALADDCPENDCKVYLNIFNMARELDKALDGATGYPATVLRGALHDRLRELGEMYTSNYAVQQYKEGMQK